MFQKKKKSKLFKSSEEKKIMESPLFGKGASFSNTWIIYGSVCNTTYILFSFANRKDMLDYKTQTYKDKYHKHNM